MPGFVPRHISVFPSPQELGSSLAQLVAQRAAESGGRFSLGLSGGSLVRILSQELPAAVALSGPAAPARWVLAFCDERLVPVEDPESTYGAYKTHLLSKISIPEKQVVIINPSLPVEEAASDYAEKLKEFWQEGVLCGIPAHQVMVSRKNKWKLMYNLLGKKLPWEKKRLPTSLDLRDKTIKTQKHKLAVMKWKKCTETCILKLEVGVLVTTAVGTNPKNSSWKQTQPD